MAKVIIPTCSRCGAAYDPAHPNWFDNRFHDTCHFCHDGVIGELCENDTPASLEGSVQPDKMCPICGGETNSNGWESEGGAFCPHCLIFRMTGDAQWRLDDMDQYLPPDTPDNPDASILRHFAWVCELSGLDMNIETETCCVYGIHFEKVDEIKTNPGSFPIPCGSCGKTMSMQTVQDQYYHTAIRHLPYTVMEPIPASLILRCVCGRADDYLRDEARKKFTWFHTMLPGRQAKKAAYFGLTLKDMTDDEISELKDRRPDKSAGDGGQPRIHQTEASDRLSGDDSVQELAKKLKNALGQGET